MATVVPQSRGPRRNIGGGVGAGVAAFFGERDKQDFQRTLAEAEQSGDKDTYRKLLMDKAESLEDALTVDKIVNRKFPDATEEIIGYDETGAERKLRIPPNLDQAKRDQLLRSKGLQATKPLGKAEPFEDAQGRATGSFLPGRQPKGSRRTSSAEAARDRRSREGIAKRGLAGKEGNRKNAILDQMSANFFAGKDPGDGLAPTDVQSVQSEFSDPFFRQAMETIGKSPEFFKVLVKDAGGAAKLITKLANELRSSAGTVGAAGDGPAASPPGDLPDAASVAPGKGLRDPDTGIVWVVQDGKWVAQR